MKPFMKPTEIKYADVPDDALMYCGDIDYEFGMHTKKEWLDVYGLSSADEFWKYAESACGIPDAVWHVAAKKMASISISQVIDVASGDMYEGWGYHVWEEAASDPLIAAGIKQLNDLFADHPSYYEDRTVIFAGEESG
jgi:hypothetical protein